ncbi:MAG: von Willebrand factor type A domain-containing protein, partial [Verrucomicrobia bacterium]|nr:von Willebrand factor type A domain-containing protein [Verrucomicrobiota bacterium]
MEEVQKILNLKLNANSIDAKIPTTSMVQLTDPAVTNKNQTFWQGLKGEYASTATIKVENDGGIIGGMKSQAATAYPYDPYFVQTTFEIMKSDAVLGQVVDAMKLDQAWSNKDDGEKLTKKEAIALLRSRLDLKPVKNTKSLTISATSSQPKEAADIANNVALAYQKYRIQNNQQTAARGLEVLQQQYVEQEKQINIERAKLASTEVKPVAEPAAQADLPVRRPPVNAPITQPEILTRENVFSTFSLNVSDVSFKLAQASLEKGQMPDAASIRSEEFINAFDYRDPEAAAGQPMAFASERAHYPFAQNRDLLRFSIKTAAAGRPAGRALNLVLLLDNSGSMERADRVAIIREALHVLAGQLQPQDTVSVVTFARTARLWADGVAGDKAGETLEKVGDITPEGGTNLEEAMRLAYETARRHYLASGLNRVVLLTDGAANLGNVDPAVLKQKVEEQRKQGIALDCFGIGFEDYDDDLLEQLSRNGDGRYAFLNSPDDAEKEFAAKLAGALQIAASDVKVQVEFNPQRVISYRQIGYSKHQLTK